jgi:ABC-type lipoprotein export system ATPase subunit
VALCRALLPRPRLVLADEPTGNLDPSNKHRVVDLLLENAQAAGATLVAVTHDAEVAERFDRVLDMAALQ